MYLCVILSIKLYPCAQFGGDGSVCGPGGDPAVDWLCTALLRLLVSGPLTRSSGPVYSLSHASMPFSPTETLITGLGCSSVS